MLLGFGSCGIAAGANEVFASLSESSLNIEKVGCNGLCFAEPLLQVITDEGDSVYYGRLNAESACTLAQSLKAGRLPDENRLTGEELKFLEGQTRIALRNCGLINPESLEAYMAVGGYSALFRYMNEKPESIIEQIRISGLRGRGGAGFPTHIKWSAAAKEQSEDKYIVCNADEGDPGAFMDRSVLEGDPHTVLEGMMIAGLAIGANHGIIYARAEYPLAIKRLTHAIDELKEAGLTGENIRQSGFSFDFHLMKGAGAFVCGEETALLSSLAGGRGMPVPKPPFPAQSGYKKKPTNINNVETFANVPWIMQNGGEAFAAYGTNDSKGTKVFALAGRVKRGGLVEVPMGITLREVVFDICGGIIDDKPVKAVQIGGPSGGCLPESLLDTPIDYASIGATGAIMGSGGLIVMDTDSCMVDMARFFMDFTSKESCGKCVACRIGTTAMKRILDRIVAGEGKLEDLEQLTTLGENIKKSALCGLGNSAPNPVLTTMKYFGSEYIEHIENNCCSAHKCKGLITYAIDADKCIGCTLCKRGCPTGAISGELKKVHIIDSNECISCGSCASVCKKDAVYVISPKAKVEVKA